VTFLFHYFYLSSIVFFIIFEKIIKTDKVNNPLEIVGIRGNGIILTKDLRNNNGMIIKV